jgi:dTDP-4-amino-4,6-dideoxygalactose transaminase
MGLELGRRPLVGVDFWMSEIQMAVLRAQLRKLRMMLAHLRANKQRLKAALADLSGLEFREITGSEGECATLLTVFFPNTLIARQVANELGRKVVADSGLRVYSNVDQMLEKRTVTAEGCPLNCPLCKGLEPKDWKRMLLLTDTLLERAINISIGVSDVGLGSCFGVTMGDGFDGEDAAEFCQVVRKYL